MNIVITGAAGYVGGILTNLAINDPSINKIVAIDMLDASSKFPQVPKLKWITANLGDNNWQKQAASESPDVFIHCAFVIRQGYSNKIKFQEKCNIQSSHNITEFCFKNKLKKLIYFSTVSLYGAENSNTIEYKFKETDPRRENKYVYGIHKRICEENLEKLYNERKSQNKYAPQIIVIRPASISGPIGQLKVNRFGLLKMLKQKLPFMPMIGKNALRQYVHEDDIANAVMMFMKKEFPEIKYEIFNLAPDDYLLFEDMANLLHKIKIPIPVFLMKVGFWLAWHISQGKIPTPPQGVKFFYNPINVDGSKIKNYGFNYKYNSKETFLLIKK